MSSILWAGKKKRTTQAKAPVRLTLNVQLDDFSYEISCGLPKPTESLFALDPEIKEEHVWFGEGRRPSNTIIERQASSAWITDHDGKRAS